MHKSETHADMHIFFWYVDLEIHGSVFLATDDELRTAE